MKKRLLFLAAASAMAFALAACSGGSTENADKKSEAAGEGGAGEQAKDDKGAGDAANELTVWCWDPNFNIYAMKEAETIYKKDHPDFKLNVVETPWNDLQTKLSTAATSGALSMLPDIILMQDNAFQKNTLTYSEAFLDLEEAGIKYDDFAAAKTNYSVVDGKHYGVPFDNGTAIAAYRTDVLEEAGLTLKDFENITWEEYIEKGKIVLEKTKKPLLSCLSGETDVVMIMLQSAGGSLFDKDGKPSIENNEILEKTIETYNTMKKEGVLVEVNDWDQYVASMNTGTVAGTINGCWILGSIQVATDQSGKWGVANIPKLSSFDTATNYSNNGSSSWAVMSSTKNKELAFDFLKSTFGSSVELYETILPKSGALATYKPAGESDVYAKPQEFFGGQAIYKDITDYASKVPSNNTGVYYYEARDAVATAIQSIATGTAVDEALKTAQETVEFAREE